MRRVNTEDMRRRVVRRSCAEIDPDGAPECAGAAIRGDESCTCDTLTPGEHDECVLVAWAHYEARGGRPCRDCAFRRGSPEMEEGSLYGVEHFYCHQGMPVDARGAAPELGNYVPDDPKRYPPCAGLTFFRRGGRGEREKS